MSDNEIRERIESELLARVAALREAGPGEIGVSRVSEISVVRVLRKCREMLDEDETAWVREMLVLVRHEAFGIQVTGLSKDAEPDQSFNIGRFLKKLLPSKEVARAGSPLPPPENLMKAAEAWVLAALCEYRMEDNVEPLRVPWEQASIDT